MGRTLVAHPDVVRRVPALGAVQAAAHSDAERVDEMAKLVERVGAIAVGAAPSEAPSEAAGGGAAEQEPEDGGPGRCPITHELFVDPVLLVSDGHTYERSAVERWLGMGHRTSPLTGAPLTSTTIVPNHAERRRSAR